MAEYLDSVRYEGPVKDWQDVPELATSEDEPESDTELVPSRRQPHSRMRTE